MKIKCPCGNRIVDQTDYLRNKGYLISDTQWFDFWNSVDDAIEKSGESKTDKEDACNQLRQQPVFKTIWECTTCGRLFINNKDNNLITYTAESKGYNAILDKK